MKTYARRKTRAEKLRSRLADSITAESRWIALQNEKVSRRQVRIERSAVTVAALAALVAIVWPVAGVISLVALTALLASIAAR